jgi:hypothetical protein
VNQPLAGRLVGAGPRDEELGEKSRKNEGFAHGANVNTRAARAIPAPRRTGWL